MAFRVTVVEIISAQDAEQAGRGEIERYCQTVDVIDLKKIIDATNYKPRGPRAKKEPKA